MTIYARIFNRAICRKALLMTETFYVECLPSDNALDGSKKAGVQFPHATPETDLDAYDELEALDEIIVGM